jgi:uncharacterized repeat protein (TIGR01451 family)/MYXO-CTERM domain-containing protein
MRLASFAATWLAASLASAATIDVTSLTLPIAVDGNCSLGEAVLAANANITVDMCARGSGLEADVLRLPAGTAELNEGLPALLGATEIRGAGIDMTILRLAASAPADTFVTADGETLTIADLTLEGWRGDRGAAVRATTLTIERARFASNVASLDGGAIHGDTVAVTDSVLSDNRASGRGGAIHAISLSVIGSVLERNAASEGGAIYATGVGDIDVVGTTLRENEAMNGGAIAVTDGATFDASRFIANAAVRGGAVHAIDADLTFTDCELSNNSAEESGGAVDSDANVIVDGGVFSENTSGHEGGAIDAYNVRATAALFRWNHGAGGGAIYALADVNVERSTFIANTADSAVGARDEDTTASESGDRGHVVIERSGFGTAIAVDTRPGKVIQRVSDSCFYGGTRAIIVGAIDARGNYWDAGVIERGRFGADVSDALTEPPAHCAAPEAAIRGELDVTLSVAGSATSGADYEALPATVHFDRDVSDVTVEVVAIPDADTEGDEDVLVSVVDGDVYSLLEGNEATVTIADDGVAAQLSIVMSVDPETIGAGGTAVYTITVANAGPGDAPELTVTDILPAALDLLDLETNVPSGVAIACDDDPPIVCTLDNLPSGAEATVTIEVRAPSPGTITNTASIASNVVDGDQSDDTASIDLVVTDEPPASDAGAGADAGVASDGGMDTMEGGCGCRATSSDRAPLALVSIALVFTVRARRRAS